MNSSAKLVDLAIRHGIYLERYTNNEAKELIKILEQAQNEILAKIEKTGGAWTKKNLEATLASTRQILKEAYGSLEAKLFDDLDLLAKYESERILADFGKAIPGGMSFNEASPQALLSSIRSMPASAGSTLGELMESWSANTTQRFVSAIRLGVAQGETIPQMVVRIRGSFAGKKGVYTGGIMETTTRGANTFARTAIMHVNNVARELTYKENEDIIKGYQRIETLDARTCLLCAPLDGKFYALGEPKEALPAHPNCRGVYIPVLKSFKELGLDIGEFPEGTRASMDGQVPDKTTYQEWLARQSATMQDDILGPSRGKLFRDGLPLTDMLDRTGKVLTLDKLREVDNS